MTALARYHAANLPELMERIQRNGIGMEDYLDRFFNLHDTNSNYPPYNLVQVNNVESRLEIALAGFKKDEVSVYTEFGKLSVEGKKEESKTDGEFVYKGLAQRSFTDNGRSPTIQRLDPSSLQMDSSPWSWER